MLKAYGDLKTPMITEMDEGVRETFRTLGHGRFSACQGEMRSVVETCGVCKGVHDERRRFLQQGWYLGFWSRDREPLWSDKTEKGNMARKSIMASMLLCILVGWQVVL